MTVLILSQKSSGRSAGHSHSVDLLQLGHELVVLFHLHQLGLVLAVVLVDGPLSNHLLLVYELGVVFDPFLVLEMGQDVRK